MPDYVLTYDFSSAVAYHAQLVAFVKDNRNISQWAQPFAGCFLLKSEMPITVLANSFSEFFGTRTLHVIAPISPALTSGILPQHLWDWLNAPQPNALSGYLGSLPPAPR